MAHTNLGMVAGQLLTATLVNRLLSDDGSGNWGLGKDNPVAIVDINGKSGVNSLNVDDRNGAPAVQVDQYGSLLCYNSIILSTGNISTDSAGTGFSFGQGATTGIFTIAAGAPSNSFIVNSAGKVGVGKTPVAIVDINGKSGVNSLNVDDRNGAPAVQVDQYGSLLCYNSIILSTGNISTGSAGTGFSFGQGATTGIFTIAAGAPSNSFIVNSAGKVGVGKTPTVKVDIDLTTEDFGIVDAGSTSATEQDWIEVQVGGNTGYIRVFAAK